MLRLLGTIEAGDGQTPPVPVSAPRLRLVLAVLGAHLGERVSTDRLLDAMWGDDPPKSAMSALQVYVSKIRRLFEPDLAAGATSAYLRSDAGAYVLELPTAAVDVAAFAASCQDASVEEDHLVEALGLWQGEPFAEFADAPWALTRSTELRQTRLRAVQRRYAAAIAAGRDGDIVDALRTDVAEQPYEERLVGLLMTALYRLGDQRGALDVFATTRELLLDELGLDPTPELQQLELLILEHDASLLEGMQLRPALGSVAWSSRPAMYGRAADLERLEAATESQRLITITGAGGVGKTRLAQEWADRHGVAAMVDLASSGGVDEALAQIAAALKVEGDPLTALATSIALALESGSRAVILDNCEHLLPSLGAAISEILLAAAEVRIIATSRQSIGLSIETIVRLDPLETPDDLDGVDVDRLAALPGVRVLIGRSGIALTEHNADDIVELLRRLDGLPLALELAAFRLRSLGAVDLSIVERDDAGTAPIDLPERHRSLDAVLTASVELLTDVQLHVLESMSTFAGVVPLEAVVRLLDRDTSAVEVRIAVAELVDRNLVSLRPTPQGVRYRLLETVRSHCRQRRAAHQTGAEQQADHVALIRLIRGTAMASLASTAPVLTPSDLDDDVAAVLSRLERERSDPARHFSLLTPLATYWYGIGRVRDARVRLRAALDAYPDAEPPMIGLASALLGMISFGDGAFHDLADDTETALEILEPMGFPGLDFVRAGHHIGRGELTDARRCIASFLDDPHNTGRPRLAALEVASTATWFADDLVAAADHFSDQARLAVSEGDTYFESHALRGEAMLVALAGDPQRGLDLCRRANEIEVGRSGERVVIDQLAASAIIRNELGDHATAVADARSALASCVRQFDSIAVTLTVPIVAAGALDDGNLAGVAKLTGWYDALCRSTGLYGPPTSRRLLDRVERDAEPQLDPAMWIKLRADGASIGLGNVLASI